MPVRFSVNSFELAIEPVMLQVPEFAALWDMDASAGKQTALADLSYVFYVADLSAANPYRDVAYHSRQQSAAKAAYRKVSAPTGNEPERSAAIAAAIAEYERLNENSEKRYTRVIDQQIDWLSELLANEKPQIVQKKDKKQNTIQFISNIKLIQEAITEIQSIVKAKAAIEQDLLVSKTRNKSNRKSSPLESGAIGYVPKSA